MYDIYCRWKLWGNVLIDRLNLYHQDIKLIIELSKSKFLYTKLGAYKINVYRKSTKLTAP